MKDFYIITGASSGIGFALSCHLAQRNKHIIAVARRTECLSTLKNKYPEFITSITADLSTDLGRNKVTQYVSKLGKIAGLVNNAGSVKPLSYLQNLSLQNWHQQSAINIDAPLFLTQSLLPYLKGGRIINITTGTTNFSSSGIATYAMSKAAINVFTKYLSDELRPKEILVTAAHPGIVKTEMVTEIYKHNDTTFEIFKAQERFKKDNKYLDVEISAKFLCWLLLDAEDKLYTGDIIGIYNKKYQPLWHNEILPSPYPDNVTPP